MGDVVGGIFGAMGASKAADAQVEAARIAADAALTGYHWITGPGFQYAQPYLQTGTSALPTVSNALNAQSQLLGLSPVTDQTKQAFNNYLGSTGYQFQLNQGQNAIASSAAMKGLLNSGGTAKALEQYGQNLASTTFNNYLNQVGQTGINAQNVAGLGQTEIAQIAGAGSQGGVGASNALLQGGLSAANSRAGMWQGIGSAIGGGMNFLASGGFGAGGFGGGGGYGGEEYTFG